MAVFSEVNALMDLVNKAINLVQSARDGWYKNSQDMASFADRVDALRRRQREWASLLERYGPRAQSLVRPTLDAAMEILEREDVVMKNRQASCWLRWSHKTLSIGEASIAIQTVIEAFEEIPRTLRAYAEADEIINRATTYDLAALPFRPDKKYVPLLEPLQAAQLALENIRGPAVVTLYGLPGCGKTGCAKYLALHYDELRMQRQQVMRASSRGYPGEASSSTCFSDGVFFLACGPEATSKALHLELWQNFGFRTIFDQDTQYQSHQSVAAFPGTEQQSYSESMIHKQLMARLMDKSVLIILDDVWQTEVLERLLLPGRGVKYLVTSQDKRVWEDAVQINIAKPSLADARKILVNHVVGLPAGEELPFNLQGAADAMITASDFNPLVLANLALTISTDRATSPDEWITARKYLLELLDDVNKGPVVYEETYRLTVATSMTMAVNTMAVEAKNLLFLAAVCDGPSVPEMVLKMFFKGLHGSLARFQKWSHYLEDRVFIQIEPHVVGWTDVPQRTWSVHGLRQHFVLEKKEDEVRSMVSSLLSAKHTDADIVSDLFLLFTAKSSTQEGEAGTSDLLGISSETGESFNWSSIKPFVWLLHADSDEDWERNAHEMVKKIIVGYLRLGHLEDTGLSSLLEVPEAQSATCWALETMARLEQRPFLTKKNGATLTSLLTLLHEEGDPNIQSRGAVALGALALKNHKLILAHPLALKHLLGILKGSKLAVDDNDNVQLYGAWTLGNLAATSESKSIIAGYPGMLEALVRLLGIDENPDCQREAAYALRRLAYGNQTATEVQSRQTRIIALPGLLNKLVDLLGRGVNAEVQREVVWLVGNVAASHDEKLKISDCHGIVNGLVGMLDIEEALFESQRYHAAYALRRLTLKTPHSKLGGIPGAVERLVDLLFDHGRPDVQQEAAHCLSFLAYPREMRIDFAAIPRAVEGLVGLLQNHVNPRTQLIATGTLANLVEIDENKLLVASEPGALRGLVRLLAKNGGPDNVQSEVGELALQCLGQLSFENYEIQLTIAASPGALDGLVESLGSSYMQTTTSNSWVQQLAAWTLCNLAEAEANRAMIQAVPSAVQKLTELSQAEGMDPDVRRYAENALIFVLSSAAAPDWTPSSSGGRGFQNRGAPTDDEAIEDLEKAHRHHDRMQLLDLDQTGSQPNSN